MTPQEAAETVAALTSELDRALAMAIMAYGDLISDGVGAAFNAQVHSTKVADVVAEALNVSFGLEHAVRAMKRLHAAAHDAIESLGLVTPKAGGGGGK